MKFFGKHIRSIYFLGIGGIGMSALARYFHRKGWQVSGYDRSASVITEGLAEEGVKIFYVMDESHLDEQDMVVYTPAIPTQALEYRAAVQRNIPMYKRAEVLGEISKAYQTLAVAGTHGKTTTSSMLAHVLEVIGGDPTAFLGGVANHLQGNFRLGASPWMVTEADEFDRSFLTLFPKLGLITSLDPDHLDIYGSAEVMAEGYLAFGKQCEALLVQADLPDTDWGKPVKSYGLDEGVYQANNLRFEGLTTVFDFQSPKGQLKDLRLHMPGHHNVSNMVGALALAMEAGFGMEKFAEAVSTFAGIYRRFQVQEDGDNISYIDDYAHHPTEIAAAIRTARACFPERQLVVVFQPHLYSRTRDFAAGFSEELSKADVSILLPIYPAREEPIPGVSSSMLLEGMEQAGKQLVEKNALLAALQASIQPPTVLLSLGAGDIDREVAGLKTFVQTLNES
ncbi:MAG: UDP-N-acetylmuramate--L-alanine ligase [Bacteroidota bacterium]